MHFSDEDEDLDDSVVEVGDDDDELAAEGMMHVAI